MNADTPKTNSKAKRILAEFGPNNGQRFAAMADHAREQERENAQLREALRFYSDLRKYLGPNCEPDQDEETVAGVYRLDVTRDRGQKARDALANVQAEPRD